MLVERVRRAIGVVGGGLAVVVTDAEPLLVEPERLLSVWSSFRSLLSVSSVWANGDADEMEDDEDEDNDDDDGDEVEADGDG